MQWSSEDLGNPLITTDALWCVPSLLAVSVRKHEISMSAWLKDLKILRREPQGFSNHISFSGSFFFHQSVLDDRPMNGVTRVVMTFLEIWYVKIGQERQ